MDKIEELISELEESLRPQKMERGAYEIGWNLAVAIRERTNQRHVLRSSRWARDVSDRLAALYKSGDDEARRCIVDSVLEHTLESSVGLDIFKRWAADPELSRALSEARAWATALDRAYNALEQVTEHGLELFRLKGTPVPMIRSRSVGTDVVVLEWGHESVDQHIDSLVVDLSDDLAKSLQSGDELAESDTASLAEFLVDTANWRPSPDVLGEWLVTLPSPVQQTPMP